MNGILILRFVEGVLEYWPYADFKTQRIEYGVDDHVDPFEGKWKADGAVFIRVCIGVGTVEPKGTTRENVYLRAENLTNLPFFMKLGHLRAFLTLV